VERGRAVIRGTAGTLSVGAGTHLASARGASFYEPEFETDVSGDTADVLIGLGSGPWVLPTTGPPTVSTRLSTVALHGILLSTQA